MLWMNREYLDEALKAQGHPGLSIVGIIWARASDPNRVNALKGFIALAIVHHGHLSFIRDGCSLVPSPSFYRWGLLLGHIGIRSLVQLRMDPDLPTSLGIMALRVGRSAPERPAASAAHT